MSVVATFDFRKKLMQITKWKVLDIKVKHNDNFIDDYDVMIWHHLQALTDKWAGHRAGAKMSHMRYYHATIIWVI